MMKDIIVKTPNQPGTLATVCETLGNAGINIEGLCDSAGGIHVCIKNEDVTTARKDLTEAGMKVVDEQDIIILDFESENAIGTPGALGKILRKIANEGISVEFSYGLENNRYVIGVDNLEKALEAIK